MAVYEYSIGLTSAVVNLETVFASIRGLRYPRGEYYPWGSTVERGDGLILPHGYPTAVWTFDSLTWPAYNILRSYCPQKSAEVYIKTRLNDGTYAKFKAIMEWPETDMSLKPYGDLYLGLKITFRRLELITWYLAGGLASAKVDGAYQAIGAASQAAALVNLNNPGVNDLTEPVAPSWSAGVGWTFNGTSQYLLSAFPPATNRSVFIRYSTTNADVNKRGLAGEVTGNNKIALTLWSTALRGYKGVYFADATVGASGVVGVIKYAGDSNHYLFYNGNKVVIPDTSSITSIYPLTIGRTQTSAGAVSTWYKGDVQAVLILNDTPTADQAVAIQNEMLYLS